MDLVQLINKYGFPIVAAAGMGYLVYYVWTWATKEIKPVLSEANTVLIALIDRIRMLDNDLIRLNQKVNIVLMLRRLSHEELAKQAHDFVVEEEKTSKAPPKQEASADSKKESK
jgi:hypothetical protein